MTQSDGPEYEVETGRRDGNVSNMAEALTNLPPSDGNVTVMTQYFAVKNLTMKDMVVLSGKYLRVVFAQSNTDRSIDH